MTLNSREAVSSDLDAILGVIADAFAEEPEVGGRKPKTPPHRALLALIPIASRIYHDVSPRVEVAELGRKEEPTLRRLIADKISLCYYIGTPT